MSFHNDANASPSYDDEIVELEGDPGDVTRGAVGATSSAVATMSFNSKAITSPPFDDEMAELEEDPEDTTRGAVGATTSAVATMSLKVSHAGDDEMGIAEEFDGDAPTATRGAAAAAFGLPVDLKGVASPSIEEFDGFSAETTRSIGACEVRSDVDNGDLPFDAAGFDASGRDCFKPIPDLMQPQGNDLPAPLLPSYLRLSRTKFRSPKPLAKLTEEIVSAFGACSVAAKQGSIDGGMASHCTWDCTMERMLNRVRLEVRVFATDDGGPRHLVEIRHLRGCRHAFAEGAADLAAELRVEFEGSKSGAGGLFRSPPPISDSALFEMELDSTPGEGEKASNDDEDERRTALHLLALMSPESDWTSQVAGCRAVGALALEVADRGASHRNHRTPFASGGVWLELATRVQSLAHPETSARKSGISDELRGELQSVAMAAVANVAKLEHVCGEWLEQAVRTASGALLDDANDDVHVKREALRAAHVLAVRGAALARQLAAVDGFLDALIDARDDDSRTPSSVAMDAKLVKFAKDAHDVCSRA